MCGYGEYLHGEAISIGMKIAGDIATEKNLWRKEHSSRQDHLIESYGLPTQTPKIKNYKSKIKNIISKLCNVPVNQINIKGKTTEKLGLIGKEKAIACEVIASLSKHV